LGGGGDLGEVLHRRTDVVRKVNAHNAAHSTAFDGDQHEGLFGDKTEHCGQCGDQHAGTIEVEVG
jgi:hypothetical protein